MAFYNIYSYRSQDAEVIVKKIGKGNEMLGEFPMCDLACVKNGFSWGYAFFYINAIYLGFKKRYSVALVMLLVSFLGDRGSQVLMDSIGNDVVSTVGIVARLGMMFLMGTAGNALVESRIISKGGQWLGSYWARSEEEAIRKFYSSIVKGDSVTTGWKT